MGYRIVYGKKKRRFRQATKGKKVLIAATVVSILLVAAVFLGEMEFLPGDRQISGAALENLVQSLQDGASLSDVIVTFCQEIIANAQIPY